MNVLLAGNLERALRAPSRDVPGDAHDNDRWWSDFQWSRLDASPNASRSGRRNTGSYRAGYEKMTKDMTRLAIAHITCCPPSKALASSSPGFPILHATIFPYLLVSKGSCFMGFFFFVLMWVIAWDQCYSFMTKYSNLNRFGRREVESLWLKKRWRVYTMCCMFALIGSSFCLFVVILI